jgi:hypothetical protein
MMCKMMTPDDWIDIAALQFSETVDASVRDVAAKLERDGVPAAVAEAVLNEMRRMFEASAEKRLRKFEAFVRRGGVRAH